MFSASRIGYIILLTLFVLSGICFLYLNTCRWVLYPAVVFMLMFVFQLLAIIRSSGLDTSLKKDIYILVGLLIVVVVSNILWVFVFPWFKYIASISSLIFVYVLFTKLRSGSIKNKLNES